MPEFGLHARRREQRRQRRRWLVPCGAGLLLAAACGRFGFESLPLDSLGPPEPDQLYSGPCNLGTVTDCSACGDACAARSLPGVAEFGCISAVCTIGTCAPGYEDCDEDPSNGCEASLESLENCGACGVPCAIPNGEASCAGGTCQLAQCAPGFGDCDADIATNGCERELNTLTNCGGCGVPCTLANGSTACDSGVCQLVSCSNGFDDCDGDVATGCETELDTLANCGSCRAFCDVPGGQDSNCSGGVCSAASCAPFRADCNGDGTSCETDLRTLSDCVSCGVGCGDQNGRLVNATASCASGSCGIGACDSGWDDCDSSPGNGCETALDTLLDCGGCDVPCARANASETCFGGSCQTLSCDPGWDNCDGGDGNGCEALIGSDQHCSACNDTCGPNQTCSGGSCVGAFNTFQPVNVDTGPLNSGAAPDVLLDCGTVTLDTGSLNGSWCGRPAPQRIVQEQSNGPDIVVVSMKSLQIAPGTTFKVQGSRPVALVVFGDVDIAGTLDVSATASNGGPGGHWECDPPIPTPDSVGANGGDTRSDGGSNGGGGGGAFAAQGGRGGNSGPEQGGNGGSARGNAALSPLIPGCNGGWGGGCGGAPGGGGGSVELAATGRIDITGSVLANGGIGRDGCDSSGGATGGGSGGGILIEGEQVFLGGIVLAMGGAGGRGANGGNGGPGSASGAGQNGSPGGGSDGGGGGGGSAGRIRVSAALSCSLAGTISPPASTSCP
jgi:hypothetical protein